MPPSTKKDGSTKPKKSKPKDPEELESVTIRFAGDSGDGVQLTGGQFTNTAALVGNDLSTFPDFPAEIRAPAGTLPGVSGFQVHFSSKEILTPGDLPQVLVAFNPAALKANIKDLEPGGTLVINIDTFNDRNFKKADIEKNPLETKELADYRVIPVAMNKLTDKALEGLGMSPVQVGRCKNFFALGMMYWMYDRPLEPTLTWIKKKFKKVPLSVESNTRALKAGNAFAENTELFERHYHVKKASIPPGIYRNITGNEATALGVVAASVLSERPLFYGSYPITPASDILHFLSKLKAFNVKTFQAEDEIAAVSSAIGASFGGSLAVTGTSGPGICLKAEAIGLAVMTELPLVILAIQRGGPSTGLPTKTEQADLLQVMFGRNGESPCAIIAASTPTDCFWTAMEACRIAMKYRLPVFMLSDGFLANSSEPWKTPDVKKLPKIVIEHGPKSDPENFKPYKRDKKTFARPWIFPGTAGFEHRIGGIEKQVDTGNVNYEPLNHEEMTHIRAEKVARIAGEIPPTKILGAERGKILIVGWGSTYGAITTAVKELQQEGASVSSIHLRHLNPLPPDLGVILEKYDKVLIPELNLGQLLMILRAKFALPLVGLNKVQGQPFKISEIKNHIREMLEN